MITTFTLRMHHFISTYAIAMHAVTAVQESSDVAVTTLDLCLTLEFRYPLQYIADNQPCLIGSSSSTFSTGKWCLQRC